MAWRVWLGVCVALAYSVLLAQGMQVWSRDVSLWARGVEESPHKVRPRVNYAVALARAGQTDAALEQMHFSWPLAQIASIPTLERHQAVWAILLFYQHIQREPMTDDGWVYEDRGWVEAITAHGWWTWSRPLPRFTLWLQLWLWQGVWSLRVLTWTLHVGVCGVLWLVLQEMTSRAAAFAGMLAFGLHPVQAETLMSLHGRFEVLAGLGVLVAVLGVLGGRPGVSVAGLALAALSKESAVVGLVLMALVAWRHPVLLDRWHGWRVVVCLAVVVAASVLMRQAGVMTYQVPSAWDWARHQAVAAGHLVGLLLLPLRPTVDYDVDAVSRTWQLVALAGWAAMLLVGVGVAWYQPLIAIGLLWLGLSIVPRLIVATPQSYLSAHQLYVPLIGWAFLVAALFQEQQAWPGYLVTVSHV